MEVSRRRRRRRRCRIRRCRVTRGGGGVGQDTRGRPVDFCGPKWQERDFEFSLGYYYLCPLLFSGWWGRGRPRQSREIGHVEIYL